MEFDVEQPERDWIIIEGPPIDRELQDALALLRAGPFGAEAYQFQINRHACLEVLLHIIFGGAEHDVERCHQPSRRQIGHRVAASLAAFEYAHQRQRFQRLAQWRAGNPEGYSHLRFGRQPITGS